MAEESFTTALHGQVPEGVKVWTSWAGRLPEACEWLLKVAAGTYLNLAGLEQRLQCLEQSQELAYFGVPKVIATGNWVIHVADAEAGVVLRKSVVNALPMLIRKCFLWENFHRGFRAEEDVLLGSCLWMQNIELHPWMDPEDEAYFETAENAIPYPTLATETRTTAWERVITRYGGDGLSTLQCVFLVANLKAPQMLQLHSMVGKSKRWFKNMACVPGGLLYPELTGAHTVINGVERSEPIFSKFVRRVLQDCFLNRAFNALNRSVGWVAEGTGVSSPAELAAEWRRPAPAWGPAADRLRRGGHLLCIFVLATAASARHLADAASVLRTWAAEGPGRPEGVEVFVVDRSVPGPPETMLRLRGDVDLGFLYNPVRAFYLWRYLAENHKGDCAWFMKADADTLVNTWALQERLQRYFDPDGVHYLGSRKQSALGSGRRLTFALNSAVLSRGLVSRMGHWLEICMTDLVQRKLGKGAEDIDLAYCLDMHGPVAVEALGSRDEMMSRGMTRASGGSHLLGSSGACTIWVHPVHAAEMDMLYSELLRLRAVATSEANVTAGREQETGSFRRNVTPAAEHLCDWPEDAQRNSNTWGLYMRQTFADGKADCWMGDFTWDACCNPKLWGTTGNEVCWDDEHTPARCCGGEALEEEAPVEPLPGSVAEALEEQAAEPAALVRRQEVPQLPQLPQLRPLELPDREQLGNPKCWGKSGFTYEACCLKTPDQVTECWAWPYTPGFCCLTPLPPRPPVRAGGLPDDHRAQAAHDAGRHRPRTARCRGDEEAAEELLACHKSLDEIGALFELSVSGAGDKASGWHDYLGVYERLLLHLPLSANVLEVGVRSGLSLAMWSEYFPLGKTFGIDKNLNTFEQFRPVLEQHGAFSRGNVHVLQANASDPSVLPLLEAAGAGKGFPHIIIDDANHWAKDQIARFEMLFPSVLRNGGVYIIEDVHIQAPFSLDGTTVRAYFANLSSAAYLTQDEILVGAHHIEAVRNASNDWRHWVESVTFLRDLVAVTKA